MIVKALLYFLLGGICIIAAVYFVFKKLDWWFLIPLGLGIAAIVFVWLGLSESKKGKS